MMSMKTKRIRFSSAGFQSIRASRATGGTCKIGEYTAALIFAQRMFDKKYGRNKFRVVAINGPLFGQLIGSNGDQEYDFDAYGVPPRDEVAMTGKRAGIKLNVSLKREFYESD